MRTLPFLAGAIALTCAQSAAAESRKYEVAGWTIGAYDTGCMAIMTFKDDETVAFKFDARDSMTRVSFTDVNATSLGEGDERKLSILLVAQDGSFDDRWSDVDFEVSVLNSGERQFISKRLGPPALEGFRRASVVAFLYDGKMIGSYSLKGTSAALAEVRRCSFREQDIDPGDVFLKD
jgi:hypothetical protein